jgi:hypothetical protein
MLLDSHRRRHGWKWDIKEASFAAVAHDHTNTHSPFALKILDESVLSLLVIL